MKVTLPRLELSMEDLDQLVERARPALSAREHEQLKAAVDTLGYLTRLVEDKDTTIQRLRQILFGVSTEKTDTVLKNRWTARKGQAKKTVRMWSRTALPRKPKHRPAPVPEMVATARRLTAEPARSKCLTPP